MRTGRARPGYRPGMPAWEAVAGPALRVTAEGEESPRSTRCFRAVRDLARLAGDASREMRSPLSLRVRYAIDTPYALGTSRVWRVSSDWDQQAVTFQAVLRPEHVTDEVADVRLLLLTALENAERHAQRTRLAHSLDSLRRLVGVLTAGSVSGPGAAASPHRRPRDGWMSTELASTPERAAGWRREFQARRDPRRGFGTPALATAFQALVPQPPPVPPGPDDGHAVLMVEGGGGVLAALRVSRAMLMDLSDELSSVTARLRLAEDFQPDASTARPSATAMEALLRPTARLSEDDDRPEATATLARFGAELGVHEDGTADAARVGVLVLLSDGGRVTRVAAERGRLAVLGFDLASCLVLLRLAHRSP